MWLFNCPCSGVLPPKAQELALGIAATALSRHFFRARTLYDLDSVNFALALQRFDPSAHQPHPPGYFLYVYSARLANMLLHDANTALITISILASCGTAALIYLLARAWFGLLAARFAALIFLVSPLGWFHGTVALTYSVEAFFSALLGYLCWRVASGQTALALPAAVSLGLAAGFRPSSLLLLAPLLVFSLHKLPRKFILAATAAFALTVLAWLLPMLQITGGLAGYTAPLLALWRLVPGRATVLNSSPFTSLARFCTILVIYGLCFGTASLLPLTARSAPLERPLRRFLWIWIAPALLLFTFVFLKFVNSGYLLITMPALCAWLGQRAAHWYAATSLGKTVKLALLALGAGANLLIFLYAPLYCSYRETRRMEAELQRIVHALPEVASPQDTLIVGFDSHFLGYRHAGYYLPDYSVVQFPEVPAPSGTAVFLMHHRDTRVVPKIPAQSYKYFLLFPLPSSDRQYRDYMAGIRARFPAGDLRLIAREGVLYAFAPIADLRLLFPSATR